MDWKQFIASVLGDLAWPLVVLALVIILKKNIGDLLSKLTKLKFKDVEAEFEQHLNDAEAMVPLSRRMSADITEFDYRPIPRFSEESSIYIIIREWAQIETELKRLAALRGHKNDKKRSALYFIKTLQSDRIIDRRLVSVLRDLREIRNVAAHAVDEESFSPEKIIRFTELAHYALGELRTLARENVST